MKRYQPFLNILLLCLLLGLWACDEGQKTGPGLALHGNELCLEGSAQNHCVPVQERLVGLSMTDGAWRLREIDVDLPDPGSFPPNEGLIPFSPEEVQFRLEEGRMEVNGEGTTTVVEDLNDGHEAGLIMGADGQLVVIQATSEPYSLDGFITQDCQANFTIERSATDRGKAIITNHGGIGVAVIIDAFDTLNLYYRWLQPPTGLEFPEVSIKLPEIETPIEFDFPPLDISPGDELDGETGPMLISGDTGAVAAVKSCKISCPAKVTMVKGKVYVKSKKTNQACSVYAGNCPVTVTMNGKEAVVTVRSDCKDEITKQ